MYVCMCVRMCVYVCMYVYIYVCIYVCMYICVCAYVYVCMYVHTHVNTHLCMQVFFYNYYSRFINLLPYYTVFTPKTVTHKQFYVVTYLSRPVATMETSGVLQRTI
jgi:hypothetical protein